VLLSVQAMVLLIEPATVLLSVQAMVLETARATAP